MAEEKPISNLEETFAHLFQTSVSGTGEEELLRIASKFSLQLSANQIRLLIYLEDLAARLRAKNEAKATIYAARLEAFVGRWLELKGNNNSDLFIMKALEMISLRRLFTENTLKVNLDKK